MFVRDTTKQPAANRTHQKASGKHTRGVEQLNGRIIGRKESRCEINCAESVDIEVEPFDQVAG